MRAFLGLGKTAPIAGLSGEMNWRPLHWHTKSIVFKYWYHINNLPNTRLPKQILLHLSKLNLKDRWYSNLHSVLQDLSVQNHNYSYSNIDVPFSNKQAFIKYTLQKINNSALKEWKKDVNRIEVNSQSGGRLALYRLLKGCPSVEDYVVMGEVDKRRVLASLRCGCLPLQIELGRIRHPKVPLEDRVCRLCNLGEIEDTTHFLITCPTFNNLRCKLFNECTNYHPHFFSLTPLQKCLFTLSYPSKQITDLIYDMYLKHKSLS